MAGSPTQGRSGAARRGPLPEPEMVRRHPVRAIDLHMGANYITIKSYGEPLTITDLELAIVYVK